MACFKNGLEELSELLRKMHVCLKEGIFGPKNTKHKKFHKICSSDFSEILCDFLFFMTC